MQTPFILRSLDGRLANPYNVLGMPVYLKVSGSDTGGQMSIFIADYKRNESYGNNQKLLESFQNTLRVGIKMCEQFKNDLKCIILKKIKDKIFTLV